MAGNLWQLVVIAQQAEPTGCSSTCTKNTDGWEYMPYDIAHFAMSALYMFLAVLGLGSLIRLRWVSKLKDQWQLNFYVLLLIGAASRAAWFCVQPLTIEVEICMANSWNMILNYLPSVVFLSAYNIILYHWAEIYHIKHPATLQMSTNKFALWDVSRAGLITVFVVFTVFLWGAVTLLLVCDVVLSPVLYCSLSQTNNLYEKTSSWTLSVCYFVSSVAFLIYGYLVYRKFRDLMPTLTASRRAIAWRLRVIMVVVPVCFMMRIVVMLYNVSSPAVNSYWYFDALYFFFLEFVPLVLLLVILHLEPQNRREISGYSPVTPYDYRLASQ